MPIFSDEKLNDYTQINRKPISSHSTAKPREAKVVTHCSLDFFVSSDGWPNRCVSLQAADLLD